MNLNIKSIKAYAAARMEANAPAARRLILMYALILAGAQVLNLGAGELLLRQADKMTGLSAIGIRSILISAQRMLGLLLTVLSPLWLAGYMAAALDLARGEAPASDRLTCAIRSPWRYLICFLLLLIRIFACGYVAVLGAALLLSFFPLAVFSGDPNAILQDPAATAQFMQEAMPLILGLSALFLLIALVLLFRYRLFLFVAADHPELRSSMVLRVSSALMQGVGRQFLRLDLSFWWYYLLLVAVEAIPLGGQLTILLDISVPMGDWFYLLLDAIYLTASTLLAIVFMNRIQVTYAATYDQLVKAKTEAMQAALPQK